jgi:hypothetical protein
MDDKRDTFPLSQSNVSFRLADIQRRCSQLIEGSDELMLLSLEEPAAESEGSNPYDRG